MAVWMSHGPAGPDELATISTRLILMQERRTRANTKSALLSILPMRIVAPQHLLDEIIEIAVMAYESVFIDVARRQTAN
jgi:hypothetical protein